MKLLKRYSKLSRIGLPRLQATPERHGLAIAVIVKNEADYIPEWVEYHRLVGVRSFYIYDNGSDDDTIAVAKNYVGADGMVLPFSGHFRDDRLNRPIDMQALAFAHAIANFGAHYRWFAFIDPDEFLVPKTSDNIVDVLDQHLPNEINISLPWHMFGPNAHENKPEGLTIENYTTRFHDALFPQSRYPFKLIVDPCEVSMISPHQAMTWRDGNVSANDRGMRIDNKKRDDSFYSNQFIQLNHYFTRSMQELRERKMARGRLDAQGDYIDSAVQDAMRLIEENQITDSEISRFAQTLRQNIASRANTR